MAAFIIILFMIWVTMWGFFKFMYPKPPKAFMPVEGDIVTARDCDYCGYPLAEYRGVLEDKPESALTIDEQAEVASIRQSIGAQASSDVTDARLDKVSNSSATSRKSNKSLALAQKEHQTRIMADQRALKKIQTWFFCNYEHQAEFHKSRDLQAREASR